MGIKSWKRNKNHLQLCLVETRCLFTYLGSLSTSVRKNVSHWMFCIPATDNFRQNMSEDALKISMSLYLGLFSTICVIWGFKNMDIMSKSVCNDPQPDNESLLQSTFYNVLYFISIVKNLILIFFIEYQNNKVLALCLKTIKTIFSERLLDHCTNNERFQSSALYFTIFISLAG